MNEQSIKKIMSLAHVRLLLFSVLALVANNAVAFPMSTGANPYGAHIQLAGEGVTGKSGGSGYKVAFFPLVLGNPQFNLAQDTETEVKRAIRSYLQGNELLELAYDYESVPSGEQAVSTQQIWPGGFGRQQPLSESIMKLAEQIGVQAVVTAYVWAGMDSQGAEGGRVDLYIIDKNQRDVYKENGYVHGIQRMLQRIFSELGLDRKADASSYSDNVAIFRRSSYSKEDADTRYLQATKEVTETLDVDIVVMPR